MPLIAGIILIAMCVAIYQGIYYLLELYVKPIQYAGAFLGVSWSMGESLLIALVVAIATGFISEKKNHSYLKWFIAGILLYIFPALYALIFLKPRMTRSELKEQELKKATQKLNALIGIASVKKDLDEIISSLEIERERRRKGLPISKGQSLHMVFTGNPGTGKTTVARIIAKIYANLGILRTGSFVEVSRADLVGQYIGHTAPLVEKAVQRALGGVLFIDEAYSLCRDPNDSNDFGREAIDTLVKEMENHRDDLVVIVAGYPKEMKNFIQTNAGLQSRFNKYIEFPDYNGAELYQIFEKMVVDEGNIIAEDAKIYVKDYLNKLYENREANFGNARDVRNLCDKISAKQAVRLAALPKKERTKKVLSTYTLDDVKMAVEDSNHAMMTEPMKQALKNANDPNIIPSLTGLKKEVYKALGHVKREAGLVILPKNSDGSYNWDITNVSTYKLRELLLNELGEPYAGNINQIIDHIEQYKQ